jgi:hypothetical protein
MGGHLVTNEPEREHLRGYDREQIGRLLRSAFPLGLGSFVGLMSDLQSEDADQERLKALGFIGREERYRS